MKVDFIIPTFNRTDAIKSMLSSLIVQTNNNWTATVVIDSDKYASLIIEVIQNLNCKNIKYIVTDKRYNDWGHTPREIGKQLSQDEYIIMTGDDNYYIPIFVDELIKISSDLPGVVYWDMVHSHYGYSYFNCKPVFNQIDMGAFATRRDIAQSIKLNTTYAADGEYIELIKHQYPNEKIVKINKVLFVHN